MNRKAILTALLALITIAGQAKIYKTIKSPESFCYNTNNGELKVREIVMTDTATTVQFAIDYKEGKNYFRIVRGSYLADEDGRHYPLHSAEGIELDKWISTAEDSKKDFTMHFEPMPKTVNVIDFIEGDVQQIRKRKSYSTSLLTTRLKQSSVRATPFSQLSNRNILTGC